MKNVLLLVFSVFSLSLPAQVFVNPNASGSGDGSSWANGHITLEAALENAPEGSDVWIKTGTYVPIIDFRITKSLNLYGGFAGTESQLNQADPDANPTVLSGDVDGNDIEDDFQTNKDDNLLHIVFVDSLISAPVSFNGLTIKGGHASGDPDEEDLEVFAGGGIFSYSSLSITNCTFNGNHARTGGSVFIQAIGSNVSIDMEGCDISHNAAAPVNSAQTAGVHIRNLSEGNINNCTFSNNATARGVVYPLNCNNISVTNSTFDNNTNNGGYGGAFFNWNSLNTYIGNCTFTNNSAGNAAGIYNDGRNVAQQTITLENCTFDGNSTTGYGGTCLYNWTTIGEVIGCTFSNNTAPNSAAGIYNGGVSDIIIQESVFSNNSASFAAAIANYGDQNISILDCEFYTNSATTSGAATNNGFLARVEYENCWFESNTASFGGAIYMQNDSTEVSIRNSYFGLNGASDFGGAVNVGGGIVLTIEDCLIEGNSADFGAGVSISEDSLDLAVLNISNTVFNFNTADNQAGAVNISDAEANITNCLFTSNIASGSGTGGVISNNASANKTSTLHLYNSTMTGNTGELAAGIAQWEGNDTSSAVLVIQNNIFNNDGLNYAIEEGAPEVMSNGGNLINDESLDDVLNAADLTNLDPLFEDELEDNYRLQEESPCIDAGIQEGAPTTDLDGNERVGLPDIGAYEYNTQVNTADIPAASTNLQIGPNPAMAFTVLQWDNDWYGTVDVTVFNQLGQIVLARQMTKSDNQALLPIPTLKLAPATYIVVVQHQNQKLTGQFIKQ